MRHIIDPDVDARAPYAYQSRRGLVRVYTCSTCGERFEWAQGKSSWHGSIKDMENQNWDRIQFACSHACRERLMAIPTIPSEASS